MELAPLVVAFRFRSPCHAGPRLVARAVEMTRALSGGARAGITSRVSPASALLALLTDEPASTSELYDRAGYPTLVRLGLVPYDAFRAELMLLSAAGLAERCTADDGATVWRRATASEELLSDSGTPPGAG
jgi:hypothetical protein